jgi:ABC-type xylose transport system substrate-binding protein
MTVFKPIKEEAGVAAKVAVGLAEGKSGIVASVAKTTVNNNKINVPSVLLQSTVVTKANVSVVVKDGAATWSTVCSGIAKSLCPAH